MEGEAANGDKMRSFFDEAGIVQRSCVPDFSTREELGRWLGGADNESSPRQGPQDFRLSVRLNHWSAAWDSKRALRAQASERGTETSVVSGELVGGRLRLSSPDPGRDQVASLSEDAATPSVIADPGRRCAQSRATSCDPSGVGTQLRQERSFNSLTAPA
jgi:hypothetical protein